MDFELDENQTAFRDLIREFANRSIRPVAREWEHGGRYPKEIVEQMAQMGLFGMLVPEEHGGIGLGAVSYAIVFEELSRAWMGIAGVLGSHSMATLILARDGTDEQRRRWLPGMASGELRSGLGLTEPDAGSDLQGIRTVARRDGDHYVVNGTKTWITNARRAAVLPVLVKTDPEATPRHRGMSLLLVERGTPGFEVTRDIDKLGYKGPESCEVVLGDCRVPAANLVGGVEGRGLTQALSALEFGRCNIAGAGGRGRPGVAGPGPRLRAGAAGVRAADRAVPGHPAQAGRHGDRGAGGPAADVVGGLAAGRRAPGRPGDGDGQAVRVGGGAAGVAGVDAGARRIRVRGRVRGGAALPGRPADGDRRGDERDPAHGDRQAAHQAAGLTADTLLEHATAAASTSRT